MASSGTRASRVWIDSYMASGSEPGKSVRPQPSRKRVSPATSRPSTRKHWLPGVWPGVWMSSTVDAADPHDVAAVVRRPGRRRRRRSCARPTGTSSAWTWIGHLHLLEQRADALERPAAHLPPEVVRVEVGPEHAGQPHAVGRQDVEEVLHGVGRVDDDRLAGLAVADQVDEVDHLAGHHVAVGEVAAREQLAEVQPRRPGCTSLIALRLLRRSVPGAPARPAAAPAPRPGPGSAAGAGPARRSARSPAPAGPTSTSTSTSRCSKKSTIESSSRLASV